MNNTPEPKSDRQKPNPLAAVLMSTLLFPGGGQMYNGQKVKGTTIAIVVLVLLNAGLAEIALHLYFYFKSFDITGDFPTGDPNQTLKGIDSARVFAMLITAAVVHVYGLIDAAIVARRKLRDSASRPNPPPPEPQKRAR